MSHQDEDGQSAQVTDDINGVSRWFWREAGVSAPVGPPLQRGDQLPPNADPSDQLLTNIGIRGSLRHIPDKKVCRLTP
jgi:hypothetical protein